MKTNRALDLLNLLRGPQDGKQGGTLGLKVVRVATPTSLVFEGTEVALDLDIFEIPADFLPLVKGKRYFALPMAADGTTATRWGLIQKLN